jgi:hypothetical protein
MSQASLVKTYHGYVHSIMSYGNIFWANSANSNLTFKIKKKRIERIIMKARNREPCHPLFRLLNIHNIYFQCLWLLLKIWIYPY